MLIHFVTTRFPLLPLGVESVVTQIRGCSSHCICALPGLRDGRQTTVTQKEEQGDIFMLHNSLMGNDIPKALWLNRYVELITEHAQISTSNVSCVFS
jgi:hypothetical protein